MNNRLVPSTATLRLVVAGHLTLSFVSGPNKGRNESLSGMRHDIGIGPSCDIRVLDPLVSALHCRLTRASGRWIIEDMNSRHGTFVNSRLVHRSPIAPGDEIILGSSVIHCELCDPQIHGTFSSPTGEQEAIPAMIAHELKNYLQFLDAGVDVIYRDAGSENRYRSELRSIHYARGQIDQLVDTLRAGCSPLRRSSCDLKTVIDTQLDLLSPSLHSTQITIDFDAPTTPVMLLIDPEKFGGVILNLLKNAIEAMNGSGKITIGLIFESEDVILRIKDTGCGMDSSGLSSMWLPLFTTKPGGSGLGAFIARTVVLRHEGRIWAESEERKGTTITIALPVKQNDDSKADQDSGGR